MYSPGLLRVGAVLGFAVAAGSAQGQIVIHVDDDAPVGGDGMSWAKASLTSRMGGGR